MERPDSACKTGADSLVTRGSSKEASLADRYADAEAVERRQTGYCNADCDACTAQPPEVSVPEVVQVPVVPRVEK